MKEFFLGNGEKGQIGIAGFDEIKRLASQDLPIYDLNNMGDRAFIGFAYFGPSLPSDLKRVDPDHNYSKETNLSFLEIQPQTDLKKEDYHRAITASVEQKPVGIIVCQWVKFSNEFWHYHTRYIDIHKEYKNQGVGTNLVKALNKADFIKGKILYLGMLSPEGGAYIAHVTKRELKAKDYALVFEDYTGDVPTSFGVFGGEFWE